MAFSEHSVGISPAKASDSSPVVQFSLIFDWKNFRLNEILKSMNAKGVSILAVSFLENSETVTVRCVVNYPDEARRILIDQRIKFFENEAMAVEIDSVNDMARVTNAIFAAEIRMHYMYALLIRPNGKIGIVMQTENNEFATGVLNNIGITTLSQSDMWR
jgi:hypothetical protein